MGMTVQFQFNLDEDVKVTKTGEKGVITMLGYDEGGPCYFVKVGDANRNGWWKESHLAKPTPIRSAKSSGKAK